MTAIHHYDPETGVFLSTDVARLDPLEGAPLVPAHATTTAPPEVSEGQAAVWIKDRWEVQADQRGQEYWLPDGSFHRISEINVARPAEALDQQPPKPRSEQRKNALTRIDEVHAGYLSTLTGNATDKEIATWPRKLLAARAIKSGSANAADTKTLTKGATQRGITIEAFADRILGKDLAYAEVIDTADAIRDKARAAILLATDETIALDQVSAQIKAAFDQFEAEAQAAARSLQSQPAQT